MKPACRLLFSVFSILLLTLLAGCVHAPMSALQGHWSGYVVDRPDYKCGLAISGSQIDYRGADPSDWGGGPFVLRADTKPIQMDVSLRQMGVESYVGKTALLILQLDGKEMKAAVAEPGTGQRPASFNPADGWRVFVLKHD